MPKNLGSSLLAHLVWSGALVGALGLVWLGLRAIWHPVDPWKEHQP